MKPKNSKLKLAAILALAAFALGTGAPKTHAAGMIVPAYLPLTDAGDWNVLKEDAAIFANGSSPTYHDFWVVVSGSSNGPFTAAADWTAAARVWDPIKVNHGALFGYVHTLVTPTGTTFRPLADVKNDIVAWTQGYSHLDGIWIDEFFPRYEIAGPTGSVATFPNGQALAPTDRSFLNPDGTFNGNQVNPVGGYYSQLTTWIHATFPSLKTIGNAGGDFYSNQVKYGGLVNVTCSFEQTYATAANTPTNNWAGLAIQAGTEANAHAALVYANSTDLNGAIDQSIAHGYEYFYTTDRTLGTNVWGGLPPYFTTEVNVVANHQ